MLEINQIHHGACIEIMQQIPDKSINLILCDLPYGVTARNKWDVIIPLDKLWDQYQRIIKENGVIILTATEPFASMLIMSNPKMFKYDLIWNKNSVTGFLNAKKMPLRKHETILVFYNKLPTYNPQMTKGKLIKKCTKAKQTTNYNDASNRPEPYMSDEYYPTSIINIPNPRFKNGHPTQKPIELGNYIVNTYTNMGDIVLDNCCGSGSFLLSAFMLGRQFIGIEKEKEYFDMAKSRLDQEKERQDYQLICQECNKLRIDCECDIDV